MQPLDGAAGLAVRRERDLHQRVVLAADPDLHGMRTLPDHQGTPPGDGLAPDPERGLAPVPLAAEGGDRVVPAPDPVDGAIPREGVVVDLLEARELGQDVRREPEEALGLADGAEGDLQVPRPPGGLQLSPSRREPQADPVRLAATGDRTRPEVVDQRVGHQPVEGPTRPIAEGREPPLVAHAQVLEGDLPRPVVVIEATDEQGLPLHGGDPERRRLGDVVVDDQVQPHPAGRARDRGDGEVLHPDARMEQLGLMAGHDQGGRRVGEVRDIEPEAAHVGPRLLHHLSTHEVAKPARRTPLEVVVPMRQAVDVPGQA